MNVSPHFTLQKKREDACLRQRPMSDVYLGGRGISLNESNKTFSQSLEVFKIYFF